MSDTIHIPVLRLGKAYQSLDTTELESAGNPIEVSVVNPGIIRRDLLGIDNAVAALQAISCETLADYCEKAAELFLNGELPWGMGDEIQSPGDYAAALSLSTGLPHSLCRLNMGKVYEAMANIRAILSGLTRGMPLSLFDDGFVNQDGIDVNFFPQTKSLGVLLPSNSPGVNSLWLPAPVLKIPVILKPGREDPFTPFRIIQAMIAAGFPAEGFGFYPTTHEGGNTLLFETGRGVAFGSDKTVKQYAPYRSIQVHGSGRSKVLIGDDFIDKWEDNLDVIVQSISANGGRSCINASGVLVPKNHDEIGHALAKKLAAIVPLERTDPDATVCGFSNPDYAKAIDEMIEDHLKTPGAIDLTAQYREGPRLVEKYGQTFLSPTLILCEDRDHPLANTEFMFPFASIVQVPQDEMLGTIGETLVVSAFTANQEWAIDLMTSTNIERLNIGPYPTNRVQWEQPHEGNIFEFLYRRRALQGDLITLEK
jgi:hypothetical protein